ncbi:MAG: sigma-70 family RNA polymerase sigma factor [Phycisphaerae bacterium]|nr:sigma-70 family RNA polymerase sigma factor [Phycisphaerae bacterium]HOO17246.1 sigma-70 family RNA polymerase sigma factor [Phycisphaerae bacterium]HPC21294.1 sigma-70 family RNA polymerase sigma factor [Phycisphaerae bacterium]HRS27253.1 sigma-70 family RNA polymerase sigma factor [Phycisphaerae bacterium]HRT42555.1 sigma-70 family RNA polymerase sigma factor [Phycisphaerae bacterium]
MKRPAVDSEEFRLLDAAAAGDREARRQLFERHRDAAYQVAFRLTGRMEDALDVVQDSFITAFEKLGGFARASGFKTWLLRIATNRALDLLRSRRLRLGVSLEAVEGEGGLPRMVALPLEERAVSSLEQQELGERIRQAVELLPPEQRAVFSLYAAGDMTYGQIADVLEVPIGTVMSRLFHARRRLHELLPDLVPRVTGR